MNKETKENHHYLSHWPSLSYDQPAHSIAPITHFGGISTWRKKKKRQFTGYTLILIEQQCHVSIPVCTVTQVFLRIALRLCAGNLTYTAFRTRSANSTANEGT